MDIKKANKEEEKLTLIEQSHNVWKAILRAKKRGDTNEVARLQEIKDYLAEQIRKGKK